MESANGAPEEKAAGQPDSDTSKDVDSETWAEKIIVTDKAAKKAFLHRLKSQKKSAKLANGRMSKFETREGAPDHAFVTSAVNIRLHLDRLRRGQRLIFRPGESPMLNYWDAASMTVLTYTALFTPFEVAFLPGLEGPSAWSNGRFIIARFIDLFFTLDLFLQFFISFRRLQYTRDGHSVEAWVEDHPTIALNYLKGWFWFDLGTLIPSAFDIIPTVGSSDGGSDLGGATIFRTFRVLRFVKILRVARAGRVMQRWAARITLQHSTKTVLWCIVRLLLAVHWFSCAFALQASLHETAEETWLGSHAYAYCDSTVSSAPPAAPPVMPGGEYQSLDDPAAEFCPHEIQPGIAYLAAFTWSMMIITGTGGTDFYPSSRSSAETVIVLLLTFIGAILWTQILANFCDVATSASRIFRARVAVWCRFTHASMSIPNPRFKSCSRLCRWRPLGSAVPADYR